MEHNRRLNRHFVRAAIDVLEPRRMLATFLGTEGADDISISVQGGETRVFINGAFQSTTAFSVSVVALGGDDTVFISRTIANSQDEFRQIGVELGHGNDRLTVRGFDFAQLDFGASIEGGAGDDTIEVDGNAETIGGRRFSLNASFPNGDPAPPALVVSSPLLLATARFQYDSAIENCVITGTSFADDFFLTEKREALAVAVSGMNGADSVRIGGGDLDSNGWLSTNTTITGGNGTDEITIDDELDAADDGPASTYTFNSQAVTRGTATINYSQFESQSIIAPNETIPGLQPIPVLTFNDVLSSSIANTTISGGLNRGCIVNFNDQDAGGIANVYEVNDTFVRKINGGQTIDYTGVTQMTLNTSEVFDSVAIVSTPQNMSLSVLGNGGDDLISLGDGDVGATIRGPVSIQGGAGTDSFTIINVFDSTPSTQTLTSTTFADVNTHNYSGVESITINAGPGAVNLAVNSVNVPTTINGGAGDDVVSIGGGNLNNNLLGNVTVNGGGGNDQLNILDQSAGSGRSHAFTTLTEYRFGSTNRTITFGTIEAASLQCGGGNDTVEIVTSNIPITVHTGGEVNPVGGFPAGDNLTVGSFGPATVVVGQSDTVLNLSVNSLLRVPSGVVLNRVTPFFDLGVNIGGTIDLAGALLFRAGSVTPDIRTLLSRGHNRGAWNGTNPSGAIHSSLAATSSGSDGVGYGLGSQIGTAAIGGFTIAPGDMLVRHALNGDADLNAVVNISDFARLAANFNGTNRIWATGDSNYDNGTNISDFSRLAANFNQSVSGAIPRSDAQMQQQKRFSNTLIDDIIS